MVLGSEIGSEAESLIHGGADAVLLVDDPRLADFIDEDQTAILVRLIETHKPEIVVCGATTKGRHLYP